MARQLFNLKNQMSRYGRNTRFTQQETAVTSPVNQATASAFFTARKEKKKLRADKAQRQISSLKIRTVSRLRVSGLAGTEKVYEHVSDKPAYCILGLKPERYALMRVMLRRRFTKPISYWIKQRKLMPSPGQNHN
jgi:hypothetical protein